MGRRSLLFALRSLRGEHADNKVVTKAIGGRVCLPARGRRAETYRQNDAAGSCFVSEHDTPLLASSWMSSPHHEVAASSRVYCAACASRTCVYRSPSMDRECRDSSG